MPTNSEYFISHVIDADLPSGLRVKRLPLHMTVISPFRIPTKISEDLVLERMKQSGRELGAIKLGFGAIRSGAIPIEIGNKAMFGENNDLPVVEILDPSGKLAKLHTTLLGDLGRIGCEYINLNPEWVGANYSPHATMKSGRELNRPFFCTTLTLHKKHQDEKTIVDTIDLCD